MDKDIEGRVRVRTRKVLPQNLPVGNGENHANSYDRPAGQYWSTELSGSVALLKAIGKLDQANVWWLANYT